MIFLGLACIWVAGFGLTWWMFPRTLGWSVHNVLLFSLGIGAGAGVASSLWFLSLLAAGPNFPVWALAGGLAAMAVIAIALTRRQGTPLTWVEGAEPPWYLRAIFLAAIALAVITFLVAVSNNPHGDEGAWSIWNLRARFLFRAGAFWRDAFSSDLRWSHPGYPLLLPGLVTLCWKLAGQESTGAPIAIAFLFALGTAGVLTSALGVLRGKTYALAGGTLLLGTASFVALGAGLYPDVPLSFYILAALALLCLQDRHPEDLRFSVLAGLMAGFGAWTRNEGVIFLAALVVARVVAMIRFRDRDKPAGPLVGLFAGMAAPLLLVGYFKLRVGAPDDLFSVRAAAVLEHVADPARWILTAEGIVAVLLTFGRFLIPIALVLALYWYLVRFHVDSRDRAALATGVISLGLTLAAELVLAILFAQNLTVELNTSMERILVQLWPAGVLLFFLASGPLQLAVEQKHAPKSKNLKKAPRRSQRVAETR
jgi:hypothetical protein